MFSSVARTLAIALVAFAMWRVATAPSPPVRVLPSAASHDAGASADDSATNRAESTPGHHHRPHHGGVVGMFGDRHLEALALGSGRVLAYLSDFSRVPLPHDDLTGTVAFHLSEDDVRVVPLRLVETATGPGMEGQGPPLGPEPVQVEFTLESDGAEPLFMDFLLPVQRGERRVGGARRRCEGGSVAALAEARGAPRPHCTLHFDGPISTILAARGQDLFVVSTEAGLPTAWAAPTTQLRGEFRELPPRLLEGLPGVSAARLTVAVRPDGREGAVALGGRLVRYVLPGAVPFSLLPGPSRGTSVAAWSADSKRVLASAGNDGVLVLINVVKAEVVRELELGEAVGAIAFAPAGRLAAVARADGVVSLFDFLTTDPSRDLAVSETALRAVAVLARTVVVGGDDGVVRVWDTDTARPVAERPTGAPIGALAISGDGTQVVAAGEDGVLRVYGLPELEPLAELRHHGAAITTLAWTRSAIVSGDAAGIVAVWPR